MRGDVTGVLDLPAACGHAGGLAKGPAGTLYVVDTRVVLQIKIGATDDMSVGRVVKTIKLGGAVKGFKDGVKEGSAGGPDAAQPDAKTIDVDAKPKA